MKASDLFVKILVNKGVNTIYGVPGEENLDLLESMRKSSIDFILTHNEQTAVFMAATYGKLTGKPGVAIATLGPGATNMMTGVAYAQLGGMPLIVITGQKPQNNPQQGQFQIVDIVSMMKPITKYSTSITSSIRIPYILENAFKISEEERPGAVLIEFPEDIAAEKIEKKFCIYDLGNIKQRRPSVSKKSIESLISEIEKAKTPVILIGAGANRKRITKYLTKFINQYNIPFFTSGMGKGVIDERKTQFLGTAATTSGDYIHKAIKCSDLIISVGYDVIEKPTDILGMNGTKLININFFSSSHDFVYSPYLDIIGDIGNLLWKLCNEEIKTDNWDFKKIYKINEKNKIKIEKNLKLENNFSRLMPRRLCNELREALNEDDILTLDNGLYKIWIARNYPAYKPNTLLLDNALATMGAGYASAMEAKRLNPKKNVVCVTGDGGLMMNLGDIETAVRLKLNITIIVLNNSSYGMIKWKQKAAKFKNFGLDFGNIDYKMLAKSMGAKGYKVRKKERFLPTLKRTLKQKGVKIIDLDFDYPVDGKIK